MKEPTTVPRSVELRKGNRYRLSVEVFFLWIRENNPEEYGQGMTRDINPSGVYIETETLPAVGSRIFMDIMLPKLADLGHGMHLTGHGVVLRVDPPNANGPNPKEGGFAASTRFFPEKADDAVLNSIRLHGGPV